MAEGDTKPRPRRAQRPETHFSTRAGRRGRYFVETELSRGSNAPYCDEGQRAQEPHVWASVRRTPRH